MGYLHENLEKRFGSIGIEGVDVPRTILDNLCTGYGQRPYQMEAFQRFILCYENDFPDKPKKPLHLLYNMATGSGKTVIMAGLMLYLFEKGYRNFLFFVNSTNIIKKTKDNFLNPQASKYLFHTKVSMNGRELLIKEVENFEESDTENINIKFTTIHKLHNDLTTTKENSITLEDFQDKKIVLIADEAHHLSSSTKQKELFDRPSWENTVTKIVKANMDNILLEFTATLDYESQEIVKKYRDKVLYKYDLAQYRKDKYSKEINLFYSQYGERERIIQALLLNLYRQELATSYNINLKPVILFKAKRTIKESEENKVRFEQLIEEFSGSMIENIRQTSHVEIIKKAFHFFESEKLSNEEIARRIQSNFKEENCLSANNEKEAEENQILLNTLEDENNPIRAIFAVQKLNEGWDVLNLFDIVRLYETRDANDGQPGKTTISEAQLVGRGARYFPFVVEEHQDLYRRKFDDDLNNDLKILEELYYHTKEDSRYISELKRALVDTGIYEDDTHLVTKKLTLKLDFKKTEFYKHGKVFFNKKIKRNNDFVSSLEDWNVKKRNIVYPLSSGTGETLSALGSEDKKPNREVNKQEEFPLSAIPNHVIRYALTKNPFFYFDNLTKYFPNLRSSSQFIENKKYLGGLSIIFTGTKTRLSAIPHQDYLFALLELLHSIEMDIKSNLVEYTGSNYKDYPIQTIFTDKEIRVNKNSEKAESQEEFLANEPWYAYNANYGTSEEKKFVEMFARYFKILEKNHEDIYLIRNERMIKIIDKLGRAFEPDFLLFCKQKQGKPLHYQIFIEPKGSHLVEHEKWKEEFLTDLKKEKKSFTLDTNKYRVTGVPFYNYENEKEFEQLLEESLKI